MGEARKWLLRAAEIGSPDAAELLRIIERPGFDPDVMLEEEKALVAKWVVE